MSSTYAIIYRTGGYARFKWNEVFTRFATIEAANVKAAEIERQGYTTKVVNTLSLRHGLPESFDANTPLGEYTIDRAGYICPVL